MSHFAQPYWLIAGLIACFALAVMLRFLGVRRQVALKKFASSQLLGRLTRHVSTGRRRLKHGLSLAAVLLLFVALARPQYGFRWQEAHRRGIDILMALDTSRSMLTQDIKPNRLERAKLGIMDFVGQLTGDRIGLMPFAGSAYLMCPLTLDYDAFLSSLKAVNTKTIPLGGTNLAAVIDKAEEVLKNDANHKILIMLTDGENLQGKVLDAAKEAKKEGMTIYTVGVGTPSGELIPLAGGKKGFVKDNNGRYVTSRLDEKNLTAIAHATGGLYVPLGNSGQGLDTIYARKLSLIPKKELAERRHKVPIERFGWPLAGAFLLLLIEFLVPERKSGRRPLRPSVSRVFKRVFKSSVPVVILALAGLSLPGQSRAAGAADAYHHHNYGRAAELWAKALKKHPENPALQYDYGTAAYKNKQYDQAIASFTKALKAKDLSLQEKAYYNRGNSYFKKGEISRTTDPDTTVKAWQQAMASYKAALKLNTKNAGAGHNLKFVQQQLKKLEKKQQQHKKEQSANQQGQQQKKGRQNSHQGQEQHPGQQKKRQQQHASGNKSHSAASSGQPKKSAAEATQPREQQGKHGDSAAKLQAEKMTGGKRQAAEAGKTRPDQNRKHAVAKPGEMTREEAINLLNSLKSQDNELNFVPRGESEARVGKDW